VNLRLHGGAVPTHRELVLAPWFPWLVVALSGVSLLVVILLVAPRSGRR
jgi:hypothetical protein